MRYAIDVFALFMGRLSLAGWVLDRSAVADLALVGPGLPGGRHAIRSYGAVPSDDVEAAFGASGAGARFSETVDVDPAAFSVRTARLAIRRKDGGETVIGDLGAPVGQAAAGLTERFWELVGRGRNGRLLEVGSRARSGITRREMVPPGWEYLGMDVLPGPNVDVVGDAHELSTLFPAARFDAVFAFSVLEHLLMPWKFATELNRVLAPGALGLFTTHQCWPIHDQPWDFWRFSDRAWSGLLNPATGFQIIDAQMGEPAFVVAQRCHPVTDFAPAPAGFLASNVLFRKVAETSLRWPVKLRDVLGSTYPEGESDSPL